MQSNIKNSYQPNLGFAKPRNSIALHATVPWNDKRWPPCGRTSECFRLRDSASAIFLVFNL